MSYDEADKLEELFDPLTRFLLLLRPNSPSPMTESVPMPGALPRTNSSGGGTGRSGKGGRTVDFDHSALVGFGSFRFDTEETVQGRDAEVVYWYVVFRVPERGVAPQTDSSYEMQLKDEARGKGLGGVLMNEMERIGRERGMSKCMLTCISGEPICGARWLVS